MNGIYEPHLEEGAFPHKVQIALTDTDICDMGCDHYRNSCCPQPSHDEYWDSICDARRVYTYDPITSPEGDFSIECWDCYGSYFLTFYQDNSMAYDTSWRTSPVYFGKDREVWTNSTNADKSGNSRNNFNPSTDESAKFHLAMDMLTLDPIVHVIDWGIYIDN
eukprot:CAMPEP_0195514920 /NCGR_PEP_ID=MMETSP0794_2-20130614/6164_1 /TAXON_ID=515487 /ORGANISM="Stephanopyxis turris, Strain CCMP 815" /LENGTH=162 /DNA_ID=CAMNT_0040643271 /DNA_START=79 /DNA_END=567 /DNA_ORIENTATION=-